MIVSQSLARQLFGDASSAVGHTIGDALIVGVAADVRNSGGTTKDDPEYYVPRSHAVNAPIYSYQNELRQVSVIVLYTALPASRRTHHPRCRLQNRFHLTCRHPEPGRENRAPGSQAAI